MDRQKSQGCKLTNETVKPRCVNRRFEHDAIPVASDVERSSCQILFWGGGGRRAQRSKKHDCHTRESSHPRSGKPRRTNQWSLERRAERQVRHLRLMAVCNSDVHTLQFKRLKGCMPTYFMYSTSGHPGPKYLVLLSDRTERTPGKQCNDQKVQQRRTTYSDRREVATVNF